jgi:hypothetical protein
MNRVDAVAISWRLRRLARFNRTGELSENFFNFPCTCPISDLAYEACLLAFLRNSMF